MRYLNTLFYLYSLSVKAVSLIYIPVPIRASLYKHMGRTLFGMSNNDLDESGQALCEFKNIGEFFCRPIKKGARPLGRKELFSPCDGTILETGIVCKGNVLTVKGTCYSVYDLIGNEHVSSKLDDGIYINIYLSPKNYHRFHIPCDGKITHIEYIPGLCFPVNRFGRKFKKLYSVNERYIVNISNGKKEVCLAIVGAAAVRGIELFKKVGNTVKKGDLLGMFKLGSSIVLVTNDKSCELINHGQIKACQDLY